MKYPLALAYAIAAAWFFGIPAKDAVAWIFVVAFLTAAIVDFGRWAAAKFDPPRRAPQ